MLLARRRLLKLSLGALTTSVVMSRDIVTKQAVCEVSSASNPLMKHDSTPRFAEIKVQHVAPAVTTCIDQLKTDFAALESSIQKTPSAQSYETVVEGVERMQAPLSYSWGVVGHLMGVKNSPELREAHDTLQPTVIEVNQKIGQSVPLFGALRSIRENDSMWSGLDAAQRRIVEASLRDMERSGVGLPDDKREAFNKLKLEAAGLSSKFSNNVLDSTKEFKLLLTDAKDVEGLPDSAKALYAQQAKKAYDYSATGGVAPGTSIDDHVNAPYYQALTANATAEKGPWLVTLDYPSYLPAMRHLKSSAIREKLYRAFVTRACEGEHDNNPIIRRLLQIRLETSRMLGYECYADQSLARKMAPDVKTVLELTDMLRDSSYPYAQKELAALNSFAEKKGYMQKGERINLWDVAYVSERLQEEQYEFEEEELKEYLALPDVLEGLFTLTSRLFGVKIEAMETTTDAEVAEKSGAVQVWDKDVRFFKVVDQTSNEHIASFFLDPYARSGEKRGGAWMGDCLGKSKVMNRKPVAYLVCNGSPPVGDTPSLMTFRDMETLFHETGHGLQHMLTTVPHFDASGINNIEWDAVELPSQFMENWCYDKNTLMKFAKSYKTGKPLPDELFDKVVKAKNFNSGIQMLRQLLFGAVDMQLHTASFDPYDMSGGDGDDSNVNKLYRNLAKRFAVLPPLDQDRFLCSFGHIFAGGYSAGYYSYKWAEVMSADAFAAFEELPDGGLMNEEAVRAMGRRFRRTVLASGGGVAPGDVFRAFRGRDPAPDALLRHSGLVASGNKK